MNLLEHVVASYRKLSTMLLVGMVCGGTVIKPVAIAQDYYDFLFFFKTFYELFTFQNREVTAVHSSYSTARIHLRAICLLVYKIRVDARLCTGAFSLEHCMISGYLYDKPIFHTEQHHRIVAQRQDMRF